MSSNDAWVMVGGIRGTPDAAAADLFQRMALACIPDSEMETPVDELRDLAGGIEAASLLKTLEVISHTTVSLVAAPEGWTCSGGSLVAWSASGGPTPLARLEAHPCRLCSRRRPAVGHPAAIRGPVGQGGAGHAAL